MKKRTLLTVVLFVLLAFPLIFSGTALAKEKYGIAFMGDLTGPLGFWNAPRLVGIQDAIEYIETALLDDLQHSALKELIRAI